MRTRRRRTEGQPRDQGPTSPRRTVGAGRIRTRQRPRRQFQASQAGIGRPPRAGSGAPETVRNGYAPVLGVRAAGLPAVLAAALAAATGLLPALRMAAGHFAALLLTLPGVTAQPYRPTRCGHLAGGVETVWPQRSAGWACERQAPKRRNRQLPGPRFANASSRAGTSGSRNGSSFEAASSTSTATGKYDTFC